MSAHQASKPLNTKRKAILLFDHYLILQSGLRIDSDKFGMINFPSYLSPKRAGSRTVYFVSEFKRIIPFVALLAIKVGALDIDLSIYPVSQSFDPGYVIRLTSNLGVTVL